MPSPAGSPARAGDLRRLETLVADASAGRGGLGIVVGEAGLGKSHLLRLLAGSAADRTSVAWGTASSWSSAEPLGVWAQLLSVIAPRPAVRAPAEGATDRDAGRWEDTIARLVPPGHEGSASLGGLARLQLFDDVRSLLEQASSARPLLLIIDDLHLLHPSSLDLLSFVAPFLTSMPVAVVGSTRPPGGPTGGASDDRLAHVLRLADLTTLGPLDAAGTAELVKAEGGSSVDRELSEAIHRHSGGNPLFALELTRLLGDQQVDLMQAIELQGVPLNVMAVVAERVEFLSPNARTVLQIAAIVGDDVSRTRLSDVADAYDEHLTVESAVDELVTARILEPAVERVRFTHGVVREAVVQGSIPPETRRRIHTMAAETATRGESRAGDGPTAAGLAAHLLASDLPDREHRAIDQLALAAKAALAAHAHVEALAHADRALGLVDGIDPRRVGLLLDQGTAQFALGRTDTARATFREAFELADELDQPLGMARAALGLGSGESGFEVPLLDQEQIEMLQAAIRRLPDSDVAWRARLMARLSVALTSTDDLIRADVSEQAVDLARRSGDAGALAAALAAHCDALAGPDHCEEREQWATEVIQLARSLPDPGLQLLGHRLRLVARLERGDVFGALGDADDFAVLADRLGQPGFQWYPHLWRALRHLLAGQSPAAFTAVDEAEAVGRAAGSGNAEILVLTHRWMHWSQVGDLDSLRQLLASFDDGDQMPRATWAWVSLAFAFAHLGRLNAARIRLDAVADDLRSAPLESEWLPMLTQVAEAVSLCGGHPVAEWTYDALLPYRHRHVVEGIGAVMFGSVERPLGLLAAARGDIETARQHFEAAVIANRGLGSPPLVALTYFEAGTLLRDPHHLERARELYDELGWDLRLAQLDRVAPQATLDPPAPVKAAHADEAARALSASNRFARDGDGWELAYEGSTIHLKDSKGLQDLATLLRRPGIEVAAIDLLSETEGDALSREGVGSEFVGGVEGSLGPLVDAKARSAYRERIEVLDRAIERATAVGNTARREKAENERDQLVAQLTAAYGLGGAPRQVGDPVERARTTVTSRIRYSIDRIEKAHPALGRHLRTAVTTGRFCSYQPDRPMTWEN